LTIRFFSLGAERIAHFNLSTGVTRCGGREGGAAPPIDFKILIDGDCRKANPKN
jgi:hypothetical protein